MNSFNPYHKWLGIPLEQQPPSYYRLLGIAEYEADLDVIESAAERQMIYLRTFQTGLTTSWLSDYSTRFPRLGSGSWMNKPRQNMIDC